MVSLGFKGPQKPVNPSKFPLRKFGSPTIFLLPLYMGKEKLKKKIGKFACLTYWILIFVKAGRSLWNFSTLLSYIVLLGILKISHNVLHAFLFVCVVKSLNIIHSMSCMDFYRVMLMFPQYHESEYPEYPKTWLAFYGRKNRI